MDGEEAGAKRQKNKQAPPTPVKMRTMERSKYTLASKSVKLARKLSSKTNWPVKLNECNWCRDRQKVDLSQKEMSFECFRQGGCYMQKSVFSRQLNYLSDFTWMASLIDENLNAEKINRTYCIKWTGLDVKNQWSSLLEPPTGHMQKSILDRKAHIIFHFAMLTALLVLKNPTTSRDTEEFGDSKVLICSEINEINKFNTAHRGFCMQGKAYAKVSFDRILFEQFVKIPITSYGFTD